MRVPPLTESELGSNTLKRIFPLAAAFALFILPATALADTFTFTTSATAANSNSSTNNPNNTNYQGGSGQFDLDHHNAYTWKINNIVIPSGQSILSATVTFKNIANWDTNANKLFVHLFNNAGTFATSSGTRSSTSSNGVTSYTDDPGDPQLVIMDNFAAANLGTNVLSVSTGADNSYLF